MNVAVSFKSDNPEVVQIIPNADGTSGELFIGAPGTASLMLEATVKVGRETVVALAKGAQFLVTTGQLGAVSGGELVFDGITEDPA